MGRKKNTPPSKTAKADDENKVYLMKDTIIEFPELYMEVYVAGPKWEEQAFAQWLVRGSCTKAKTPDEADLVIFPGGSDIDPALYGKSVHEATDTPNPIRDKEYIKLFLHCVENGIPMMGVCGGAQFGHVMKGGTLYQHVDGHNGDHHMWDNKKDFCISQISSVHHQMVNPDTDDIDVIATCKKSSFRYSDRITKYVGTNDDVEAFFYRDICFFGVQGHPEYRGYQRYSAWAMNQLNELVICNPDLDLIDNVRRIKPENRVNGELSKLMKELV